MGILSNIFSSGAAKLAETVTSGLDSLVTSKEEKEAAKLAIQQAIDKHVEAMEAEANKVELAYLADMDSARNMQAEALKQNDIFSKRFVYYLASFVVFAVICYDILFFFIKFPPENRDVIVGTSSLLNGTAFVMVLSFFFGSSKGSKDGADRMDKMMDKVIESK